MTVGCRAKRRELSDAGQLHGQNDDRSLLNPRGHRSLLDSFAGLDVSAACSAWRAQAQARFGYRTGGIERAQVEEDFCAMPWPNSTSSTPNRARPA